MALLLPNLRWVMFDANLNVRVRMASLVKRVSQIKTFEWWNIFPVAELLSVMAKDCDAVAKTVQAMLFSQYIDCGASSSLEVRCEHIFRASAAIMRHDHATYILWTCVTSTVLFCFRAVSGFCNCCETIRVLVLLSASFLHNKLSQGTLWVSHWT